MNVKEDLKAPYSSVYHSRSFLSAGGDHGLEPGFLHMVSFSFFLCLCLFSFSIYPTNTAQICLMVMLEIEPGNLRYDNFTVYHYAYLTAPPIYLHPSKHQPTTEQRSLTPWTVNCYVMSYKERPKSTSPEWESSPDYTLWRWAQ